MVFQSANGLLATALNDIIRAGYTLMSRHEEDLNRWEA